jgi:hypothetical protein
MLEEPSEILPPDTESNEFIYGNLILRIGRI